MKQCDKKLSGLLYYFKSGEMISRKRLEKVFSKESVDQALDCGYICPVGYNKDIDGSKDEICYSITSAGKAARNSR